MPEKKSFLLRMDAHKLELLKRWADDEFRSLNGHLEYLLEKSLREADRLRPPRGSSSKRNESEK
jgi:hypothetical protein